jgi:hypothetical protein
VVGEEVFVDAEVVVDQYERALLVRAEAERYFGFIREVLGKFIKDSGKSEVIVNGVRYYLDESGEVFRDSSFGIGLVSACDRLARLSEQTKIDMVAEEDVKIMQCFKGV